MMSAQNLIDELDAKVQTERHHRLMGRDALAATYRPQINAVLAHLVTLGYNAIDCLDAVGAD